MARNEEQLLDLIVDLSPEWQEWMFGSYIEHKNLPLPITTSLVYCIDKEELLRKALSLSIPEWLLFLPPRQSEAFNDITHSSICIQGGPGTGKTTTLLKRFLDKPQSGTSKRVLFTYSRNLAYYFLQKIENVVGNIGSSKLLLPFYLLTGQIPESLKKDEKAF